jgi:F0F1-type ATP synthase membrane subunit c/vacuolar-type H+-ATPase subunit K
MLLRYILKQTLQVIAEYFSIGVAGSFSAIASAIALDSPMRIAIRRPVLQRVRSWQFRPRQLVKGIGPS